MKTIVTFKYGASYYNDPELTDVGSLTLDMPEKLSEEKIKRVVSEIVSTTFSDYRTTTTLVENITIEK